jgi:hypothetical protein
VIWGGFVLQPNESATITLDVSMTPAACAAGQTVTLITGTRTTARTPSGGFVDVTGGPVTTNAITGLSSTTCAGAISGALPAAPGPAAPAPAAAAPTAAATPTLPRVGTGVAADHGAGRALAVAAGVALLLAGAGTVIRRRHA